MKKRLDAALLALLFCAVVLSMLWNRLPLSDARGRLEAIPLEALGLSGRELPLTDLETRWLGGASGIKRLYLWGGARWILVVTDGTQNRHAVHDPTYCFRGAGWRVCRRTEITLCRGCAEAITIERGGQTAHAAFWFDDGSRAFRSPVEFWFRSSLRRLTRGTSGSEPLLFLLRPLAENACPDWPDVADRLIPLLCPPRMPNDQK